MELGSVLVLVIKSFIFGMKFEIRGREKFIKVFVRIVYVIGGEEF